MVLLSAGCGAPADRGGEAAPPGRGAAAPDRSPTGTPAGSDPAAVTPYVEDLLAAHDRLVNEIVVDPSVAGDSDHPLVREYADLYEPDSESVTIALGAWRARSAAGISTQPFDPDHPAFTSQLDGPIETVSDDEVRFPTCDEQRYGTYDDAGALLEVQPFAAVAGEGVAVRVGGDWKLRRLDLFGEGHQCAGSRTSGG